MSIKQSSYHYIRSYDFISSCIIPVTDSSQQLPISIQSESRNTSSNIASTLLKKIYPKSLNAAFEATQIQNRSPSVSR